MIHTRTEGIQQNEPRQGDSPASERDRTSVWGRADISAPTPAGKRVGNDLYIHVDALNELDPEFRVRVQACEAFVVQSDTLAFNVVRIELNGSRVAFLSYPTFDTEAFPCLRRSYLVDLTDGSKVQVRDYTDSNNPPMLHRKELLLAKSDSRCESWTKVTAAAEAIGLFDDPTRIGYAQAWWRLIQERGYHFDGTQFVPIANAPDEWSIDEPGGIARHLTALTRYGLSAPIQALLRFGFFDRGWSLFDYGCGKGDDLRNLAANGIAGSGWDPFFAAEAPRAPAEIVNLGFVLNVIESRDERDEALRSAFALARRVLAVSVMLASNASVSGKPFGDGYLTQRGTFQRYYTQSDFRAYLESTLGRNVVLVAPGVAFIFADPDEEQRFLFARLRSTRAILVSPRANRSPTLSRAARSRRDPYEEHAAVLDALWVRMLDYGRIPAAEELGDLAEQLTPLGAVAKACRIVIEHHGADAFEAAAARRRDDLRVFFALQRFSKRKPYSRHEPSIQRAIRAFFGTPSNCETAGFALLSEIANVNAIDQACKQAAEIGLGDYREGHSLQIHSSLVSRLPALLRVYVGAAAVLYGDIASADLVKIHTRSGKLSLLEYHNFDDAPAPTLKRRVKIKLRDQDLDVFDYSEPFEPTVLLGKARYLHEESPRYAEQRAFDEALANLKCFDFASHGPTLTAFNEGLKQHRVEIDVFRLSGASAIPPLDQPCGRYFRYRDFIACGETQRERSIANRPTEAASYNALFDLAVHVLDPIIDYFGMVRLAFGFCSAELAKHIPGRIAPALDQHAAHERNRLGNFISPRLGAAVDLMVEDENMMEVAQWIATHLPFDRLYVYAKDRPLHVSFGPQHSREVVFVERRGGRTVPRVVRDVTSLSRL